MSDEKKLKAGDPCPTCGGALVLDATLHPDRVIEKHGKVAASPHAHARFAETIRAKAAADGLIHTCETCAYQSRFAEAAGGKAGKGKAA
jgi:ssDNA-binding Zn-finger/Zn-ribbon topoisomerase 1